MRIEMEWHTVCRDQWFRGPWLKLILIAMLLFPVSGFAQAQKKQSINRDLPIHIQSDRLEAYQEKRMIIFSGNAVATQGDKTIKADRLLIYYKANPDNTKKKDIRGMETSGDLDKLEAQGHVTVTQANRVVRGDNAIFYQDSQKVEMTGNAVMREGKNLIRGDKIVVFLDEDRGIIESGENKRVTATIYPNEKKEEHPK